MNKGHEDIREPARESRREASCPRERFFVETRKPDDGDAGASSRRADEVFGEKDPRGGRSRSLGVRALEEE
jgi:hypothetical protein